MVVRYKRPIRPDELYHYGVLGMKWGVRRYQNEDGSWKGAGARARHAQQQAASESGHTKHQTHSSSGGSGKKTKKKHSTAKTVAKVAGVSLAVAAGAYAAHKTGLDKRVAKSVTTHGAKTLNQIRNSQKVKTASSKVSSAYKKAKNKASAAYNSNRGKAIRSKANSARNKFNNFRRNTRRGKLYVQAGYNAIDTASDIYGAGKFVKENKNNFKTKSGRKKVANKTIKNKKWRRKQYKNAAKKIAINAAIRAW